MFALSALPALAQQVPSPAEDPVAEAPVRFGPVGIAPQFSLQNIGVDTNVFNATVNPESDFTFTGRSGADLWLRTGRGIASFDGWLEYVYFQDFASERSFNSYIKGQYEWRFSRLRPYATGSYLDTRERPGYEIDQRIRRYEGEFHAGTDFRAASKTTLRLDFRHIDFEYEDRIVDGRPVDDRLNRTQRAVELSYRQRLTALTTWVARVTTEQERFHIDELRNSDSFRLTTGFELGRFALIRGTALAGYRKLTPADGGFFAEFSGLTANVNVNYTAPTQTRLNLVFNRDVQYSYDNITPYYVLTQWTGTLTQRIIGRWDLQATGGRDRLAYEAISSRDARTDYVGRFGGGIGYTFGEQLRLSFDVQSIYRSSPIPTREFGNLRAGFAVTYGS